MITNTNAKFYNGERMINMKKTVAIITMITIVAKIVGFGREMALSFVYGASEISDAYLIANTIPNVIFGAVSS